ncbi:MAG: MerR family transcriptional regulator [Halioglobus sp.]
MGGRKQALSASGDATYRISQVVAASGVSRDRIKSYLRTGLLPPPQKPRPKLALYNENHLALIELAQKFQDQTKLSVPEIATLFRKAQYDTSNIEIDLLSAKHGVDNQNTIIPLKHNPGTVSKLNLPEEFLQLLVKASLLEKTDHLSENEGPQVALLWAAYSAGVPLTFFETAQKKLAELADLEVETLIAIKRPTMKFHDTVENITDVDRIINRWMITEKNRRIRNRFQQVIDNSERAISTLLDTIYRPSSLFRKYHGVDGMLSRLWDQLLASPVRPQDTHDLCFACLLLGEYGLVISIAEMALAKSPGNAIATAFIALAQGLQNNVDEAFECGSRLENSEVQHTAILQARMLSLLLKAAKQGGVTDPTELMKRAGELFLELPRDPSIDQPDATLLLARANVAFPDFANSRPHAIRALQSLRQRLDHKTIELPALPIEGLRDCLLLVHEIYVLYYLGVLHTMDGDHAAAAPCFEQVIRLDPACNFAASAYQQLGQAAR